MAEHRLLMGKFGWFIMDVPLDNFPFWYGRCPWMPKASTAVAVELQVENAHFVSSFFSVGIGVR